MMAASSHSYTTNSDGDGLWMDSMPGVVFKKLDKLNLLNYQEWIEKANTVFSFQRLATSGHVVDFVQPFKNEDFVFMHNGVVNEFLNRRPNGFKGSDSYAFFLDFTEKFKSFVSTDTYPDGLTREVAIIRALKVLLENISSGWYSMILFDRVDKTFYYFRGGRPQIHFYRYKGMLYITTNSDNVKFLSLCGQGNLREISIGEKVIYKISVTEDEIKVAEVGEIVEQRQSSYKSFEIKTKEQKKIKGWNNWAEEY